MYKYAMHVNAVRTLNMTENVPRSLKKIRFFETTFIFEYQIKRLRYIFDNFKPFKYKNLTNKILINIFFFGLINILKPIYFSFLTLRFDFFL